MAEKKYVLAIDQSTQGTKGILFDAEGQLICRRDVAHEQIVGCQNTSGSKRQQCFLWQDGL